MRRQKRILMLGATQEQIIAINKARQMGLYVITCDNRPDNPGHALADECHNVSITDKEAVLALANSLQVDGILSYVLEAGVEAAAYASEHLGLPTVPYHAVKTLSNKKYFREFLRAHGFNTPKTYDEGITEINEPLIVKPTDMWGSRGVMLVRNNSQLDMAVLTAKENSRSGNIIMEEYIGGIPLQCDAFLVNGRVKSCLWSDVLYDDKCANTLIPVAGIFPTECDESIINRVNIEVERLAQLLNINKSPLNIEVKLYNDRVYIMEMAPRNGGNYKSHLIELAMGVDYISGAIKSAMGLDCGDMTNRDVKGYWLSYAVHSPERVQTMSECHKLQYTFIEPHRFTEETSSPFLSTKNTTGLIIAQFDNRDTLNEAVREHSINNSMYL